MLIKFLARVTGSARERGGLPSWSASSRRVARARSWSIPRSPAVRFPKTPSHSPEALLSDSGVVGQDSPGVEDSVIVMFRWLIPNAAGEERIMEHAEATPISPAVLLHLGKRRAVDQALSPFGRSRGLDLGEAGCQVITVLVQT